MRKSMRELEEACARLGKPVQIGIADELLPLVRQTQHLLHSPSQNSETTIFRSHTQPKPLHIAKRDKCDPNKNVKK